MRITLRGHSCLEVSTIDGSILLDPGAFSDLDGAFEQQSAILITHQHPDHASIPAITAALNANSLLNVYAPEPLAQTLRENLAAPVRSQVRSVAAGQDFVVGGIRVRTFGGTHATIHHSIALVANVGYLLGDGDLFHPGDSYQVPIGVHPKILLLPLMAPWGKMAETVDYAQAINAPLWVPIHDGLLNDRGLGLFDTQVGNAAVNGGCSYQRLNPGTAYEVASLVAAAVAEQAQKSAEAGNA